MTFSSNQGQENLGTVYSQRIRWDSSEPIIFNQTVSHSLRVALYTKMDPMAEVSSAFISGPMLPRISTHADIYVTPIRSKGFLLINCILQCNICTTNYSSCTAIFVLHSHYGMVLTFGTNRIIQLFELHEKRSEDFSFQKPMIQNLRNQGEGLVTKMRAKYLCSTNYVILCAWGSKMSQNLPTF